MTPQYPKRLIEVDLPIKRISAHARREKSIRHGHISTLHIWWARRPLAACRAVICASLWPDPADPLCPQSFRDRAAKIIYEFACTAARSKELGESCDHETWLKWQSMAKKGALDSHNEAHWNVLRFALLDFIADFANWDNSTVKEYLDTSRALTQAAHEALGGEPGTRPLVVDPFAGGGSIPLEALRVGADAFASDLNPVAVTLNKAILELVPRFGQRLAEAVRDVGARVKAEAEEEIGHLYPKESDGTAPSAYLWARTIACEGPGCGAEVPMIRSLWLNSKGKKAALELVIDKKEARIGIAVLIDPQDDSVGDGTVRRGSVTCPCCGYTTRVESVRNQLKLRRGGADDARLIAVYCDAGFRAATTEDYEAVRASWAHLDSSLIPIETISKNELRRINVPLYGMTLWSDIFSVRQRVALSVFSKHVIRILDDEVDPDFRAALALCLAFAVDRCADYWSSLALWAGDFVAHTFGRQAIPFVTDFAEVQPFASASGNWDGAIDWIARVLEREAKANRHSGVAQMASASAHPLPDDSVLAVVTDPPYYDAVPYAYLSDYFYVWMKRILKPLFPELMHLEAVPKADEIVVDRAHRLSESTKGLAFYEEALESAFQNARRILRPEGICVIVFASKTTASWEAVLQSVVDSEFSITGSWPIDTERQARVSSVGQARLQSSVHLVCRPRSIGGPGESIGSWRDVLQELPERIHEWMPRLASEGIVGADAIFACLGPALEIFSRYNRVEKANGDTVSLREYLEHVWAAVAKEALAQVFKGADATGFEPDARLTAMWLWTLNSPQSNGRSEEGDEDEFQDETEEEEQEPKKPKAGGFRLEYDAARKIAQGLGAALEDLAHLVQVKRDEARLLPVAERTQYLFGKDQDEPTRPARKKAAAQLNMFAELTGAEDAETAWQEKTVSRLGETTLDRVHQAMILFAAGRGAALKRFIVDESVGQDGKFWRLAQALSALYPAGTDERRWVEGVMARKKQFGF